VFCRHGAQLLGLPPLPRVLPSAVPLTVITVSVLVGVGVAIAGVGVRGHKTAGCARAGSETPKGVWLV
jgi:hypothetical protein